MNSTKDTRLWFILIPALSLWLGWGVRGVFGHSNGAMFPGALLALALCFLLKDKRVSIGLVIALTAVGFGFGADQTTLQTAGFLIGLQNVRHMVNLGIAYPGLAIKGALWASFGGAGLGLALTANRYRKRDLVIGVVLMILAFQLGWWIIDKPKLIDFSLDRREIWGGLLFGLVTLLIWMTRQGKTRIPLKLAGWAALGGAVGYPIAVTLNALGTRSFGPGYPWWKLTETTFGFIMGAFIGNGVYLLKDSLPSLDDEPAAAPAKLSHPWGIVLGGAVGAIVANTLYAGVMVGGTSRAFQTDLPWILLGPVLWCVALYFEKAAWHIGVTMTFVASATDLILHYLRSLHVGNTAILWTLVILATLGVAWKATGWSFEQPSSEVARRSFLFLMWALVALACILVFVNEGVVRIQPNAIAQAGGLWPYLVQAWGKSLLVGEGFIIAALLLTRLLGGFYRSSRVGALPPEPGSPANLP